MCFRIHRIGLLALVLGACVSPALLADATIRYQNETKHAPWLPATFDEQLKKTAGLEPAKTVRIKDHKSIGGFGGQTIIADLDKREYTILDPAHKTAAVVPFAEFTEALASAAPDMPPLPASFTEPKVESHMTGRIEAVQGVESEEREVIITWEFPPVGDLASLDRSVKLRALIWSATQAEAARIPAIREFTEMKGGGQDLTFMLRGLLGKFPWMNPILEAFRQPTVALRLQVEVYVPMMTVLFRKEAEQAGNPPPAIDANAPFLEFDQLATEISNAPIDPAAFEIPGDYSIVPPEKFRALLREAAIAPAGGVSGGIIGSSPTAVPPPRPTTNGKPGPGVQRIRVGGNVQAAKLIRQPKPVYPPLAMQARISGIVTLKVLIDQDGTVLNLTVVSGHPLLIPAALDAVKQWVYAPTLLNGEPVQVETQIDVTFALTE